MKKRQSRRMNRSVFDEVQTQGGWEIGRGDFTWPLKLNLIRTLFKRSAFDTVQLGIKRYRDMAVQKIGKNQR